MKKFIIITTTMMLGVIALKSCTKKAVSGPNFVFKPAPSEGVVAQFRGKPIRAENLYQGIEQDLYGAQKVVYEIKLGKLKSFILEELVKEEANNRGLSHDQFLNQVIAKNVKIDTIEIEKFAKEKGIPQDKLDAYKKRIERFLMQEKKKTAIEKWLAKKTAKSPVEVYLEKPVRPVFTISISGSPFVGNENAKVVIAEFSDFQCQYCQKGANFLKEIKNKYGNKVKIVFKNFPLSLHNHGMTAALAGLCAQDQGHFWQMHDKMFENQDKLDKVSLLDIAKGISGISMQDFTACLESKKHMGRVQADREEGTRLGVRSTPTFFVNGKVIAGVGEQEKKEFMDLIEEGLAQ